MPIKPSLKQNFPMAEGKDTWLRCQGYTYESNPADTTTAVFTTRERESRQSHLTFFGKIASDVFSYDKYLLSYFAHFLREIQVRICFDLRRCCKKLQNKLTQANLYFCKITI